MCRPPVDGLRVALLATILALCARIGDASAPCNASVLRDAASEYLAASWDHGLGRTRECASCTNFSVRGADTMLMRMITLLAIPLRPGQVSSTSIEVIVAHTVLGDHHGLDELRHVVPGPPGTLIAHQDTQYTHECRSMAGSKVGSGMLPSMVFAAGVQGRFIPGELLLGPDAWQVSGRLARTSSIVASRATPFSPTSAVLVVGREGVQRVWTAGLARGGHRGPSGLPGVPSAPGRRPVRAQGRVLVTHAALRVVGH